MGTKEESYRRVKQQLQQSRLVAEREADARREALYAEIPEIAEIDRALQRLGMQLFRAAMQGSAGLDARLADIRANNEQLQADRAEMLHSRGYPADYTEPRYACAHCKDTGYVDGRPCACMKQALVLEGFAHSGLGALLRTQSFETFSLSVYPPEKQEHMKRNLQLCRAYAEQFDPAEGKCLLLYGATGLGKTHLSTSIAQVVIKNGYDVRYESAQRLFEVFEESRFTRYEREEENPTYDWFHCDLLILDDLGTEAITQYSVSCLYHLLNTRINAGLSFIINTNLFDDDLMKKYQDRIVSRIFGTCRTLLFVGNDVRKVRIEK